MTVLRFLLALVLAVSAIPLPAAAQSADDPLIVMIETNPWLMVIGSDSPAFVFYKNGDLIYRDENIYRIVRLTGAESAALLQDMNLPAAAEHAGSFELTHATDQPEQLFLGFDSDEPWAVRVYGRMTPTGGKPSRFSSGKVPSAVQQLYDIIAKFGRPDAAEWLPDTIEVMIWPYDYAPDASIHWPKDWPGLDHPDTRKRGDESYSLFVPSTKRAELRAFLDTRTERGAVEIGGKKWAVSTRYPFPGEARWMRRSD